MRNLMKNKTVQAVVAGVLIVLSGGAWLYLDCLNKQEETQSAQMQQEMLKLRAESKQRLDTAKEIADAKLSVGNQIRANLASCQAAAEKSHKDYLGLIEKILPRKRGQVLMPPNIASESNQILTAAKAECQQNHDTLMPKAQ